MPKSSRSRRGGDRSSSTYLSRLGQRIREGRAQRGMTRRSLVSPSNVSERFLAQLESGQGNPSALVLRQIADALSIPLEELVSDREPRSVDYRLILQTLDRLSIEELGDVRRFLAGRFPRARDGKERYITLIGLRGAGKTTLGKRLADHLSVSFVELDREVEREYGASIGEILALSGQAGYLRYERQCLEKVIDRHSRAVIEIGGGLATDPETLGLLLEITRTIWVRAQPREHMRRVVEQGDLRPMANNDAAMKDLNAILQAREPFYKKASLQLDTSGETAAQSLKKLIKLLRDTENAPNKRAHT